MSFELFKHSAIANLARLPPLAQIRRLTLETEFTDKAVRLLFETGELELESLTIRGEVIHDYLHTLNERRVRGAWHQGHCTIRVLAKPDSPLRR